MSTQPWRFPRSMIAIKSFCCRLRREESLKRKLSFSAHQTVDFPKFLSRSPLETLSLNRLLRGYQRMSHRPSKTRTLCADSKCQWCLLSQHQRSNSQWIRCSRSTSNLRHSLALARTRGSSRRWLWSSRRTSWTRLRTRISTGSRPKWTHRTS